jgi:hypothetical protein
MRTTRMTFAAPVNASVGIETPVIIKGASQLLHITGLFETGDAYPNYRAFCGYVVRGGQPAETYKGYFDSNNGQAIAVAGLFPHVGQETMGLLKKLTEDTRQLTAV